MKHYNDFESINQLLTYLEKEKIPLPFSYYPEKSLRQTVTLGEQTLQNSISIQPMEGCDATSDGRPDELTFRRYKKFAASGAGMIWFEATAVMQEARANPRQLYITKENADSFAALVDEMKKISYKQFGWTPKIIMQATHSGRFSKPNGVPEPIIAYHNPILNKNIHTANERIITDDELKTIEEKMGETAALAQRAGFDGMDIKSCHCYLFSEMLSAYRRPGIYGGCFENRTRLLRNSMQAARSHVQGDFLITTRLNAYDGFAYPFGFGASETGMKPDLAEAKQLVAKLHKEQQVQLVNITIGTPYVNPHMNRPANQQTDDIDENPFWGVYRMLKCIKEIKVACPEVKIVGSGLSYPGAFAGNIAAGALEDGYFDIAGFGRMAFANPSFPQQLLNGGISRSKACIACGKCTELMRAGSRAGCVIRDEVYTEIYRKDILSKKEKAI